MVGRFYLRERGIVNIYLILWISGCLIGSMGGNCVFAPKIAKSMPLRRCRRGLHTAIRPRHFEQNDVGQGTVVLTSTDFPILYLDDTECFFTDYLIDILTDIFPTFLPRFFPIILPTFLPIFFPTTQQQWL